MTRFIRKRVEVSNPGETMVRAQATSRQRAPFDPQGSNIFLVGLRGSGKTTLGRLLADRLGVGFVDTDEAIIRQTGQDIAGIVADKGWDAFRALEAQALRDICVQKGQVVATGGGIVLDPGNQELLQKSGVVFYLIVKIPTLVQRLAKNPLTKQRPPLSSLSLPQELGQCLLERGSLYMRIADHVLLAETGPAALVEDVLEKLEIAKP